MVDHGFKDVIVAEQEASTPSMLPEQAVVLGLSDGCVRVLRTMTACSSRTCPCQSTPLLLTSCSAWLSFHLGEHHHLACKRFACSLGIHCQLHGQLALRRIYSHL